MGETIEKAVFDRFFAENYCAVEYEMVKAEFEAIAAAGNGLFADGYEAGNLKKENFILYLTQESYCDFEAAVQEAFDALNPEILDAVIDVTTSQPDGDLVTARYWDTMQELLHEFLLRLYEEVIG